MFIDDIATYLQSLSIANTTTNMSVGNYPDDPDTHLAVLTINGQLPDMDIAALRRPSFQLIARSANLTDGYALINAAYNALHCKFGLKLTNYYVMRCHAQQDPTQIGKDARGRHEWSCNFYAETKPLPPANP